MTQLYTSTQAAAYLAGRDITIKPANLWRAFRRRDIEPQGTPRGRYVTEAQLEQFVALWRPRAVPQRAPKNVNRRFTISPHSKQRERLAPQLDTVVIRAQRAMLARRRAVAVQRARTGMGAREAVAAVWEQAQ